MISNADFLPKEQNDRAAEVRFLVSVLFPRVSNFYGKTTRLKFEPEFRTDKRSVRPLFLFSDLSVRQTVVILLSA